MRFRAQVMAACFAPVLLLSFEEQPEKKCTLTGHVTNILTGETVRKATVHLAAGREAGRSGGSGYVGTTDAEGRFRFEKVDPGVYTLSGGKPGYLRTNFGAKGAYQAGTLLRLGPGQEMTDLNLALTPQAVISGRVADEDGDAVSDVNVVALKQTWNRGKLRYLPHGQGSTNDLGEYRIGNLTPGKYVVYARIFERGMPSNELPAIAGKPDMRQVRTFFPDAAGFDRAAPVTVIAGQSLAGTDIRMLRVPTFHVRGKVAGTLAQINAEQTMLTLAPREAGMFMMFGERSNLKKDFSFDISGVAPGSYSLDILSTQGGFGGMVGHQAVDVGTGDLNDVVLTIIAPGVMKGKVTVQGGGANSSQQGTLGQIALSPVDEGVMVYANAVPALDGTFSLANVAAEKYHVNVWGVPEGAYVKSIRWGQQEVLGKELDLSNGVSGELEVVIRYGAPEVSGVVEIAHEAPAESSDKRPQATKPSISVVLVPEVLNADGSGIESAAVDQNGSFTLKQARPGRYLAYALEDITASQIENPDVLKQIAAKGTAVELKENEKKQLALKPIAADEMRELFARLGIAMEQ